MEDPVVVATGPPEEKRWGFYFKAKDGEGRERKSIFVRRVEVER